MQHEVKKAENRAFAGVAAFINSHETANFKA
jgi:hypothetical protein